MESKQYNAKLNLYTRRAGEMTGPKSHPLHPEPGSREGHLAAEILGGLKAAIVWRSDHRRDPANIPLWTSYLDFDYSSPAWPDRQRKVRVVVLGYQDCPVAIIAVDFNFESRITAHWDLTLDADGTYDQTGVISCYQTADLQVDPQVSEELALAVGRVMLRLVGDPGVGCRLHRV